MNTRGHFSIIESEKANICLILLLSMLIDTENSENEGTKT